MTHQKVLTKISFILTVIALTLVVVLMFAAPALTKTYLELVATHAQSYYAVVLLLAYAALAVAAIALCTLINLLKTVAHGEIFSTTSYKIMTVLAVCCFLEMLVFLLLGYFFLLSYVISFAVLLVGVLLLVLRCVLAEAAEIKAENDYTV